jgi:hypothetical protein
MSGRLISKREMRDEGESLNLRNLYECTLLAQGKGQTTTAATIPIGRSNAIKSLVLSVL